MNATVYIYILDRDTYSTHIYTLHKYFINAHVYNEKCDIVLFYVWSDDASCGRVGWD